MQVNKTDEHLTKQEGDPFHRSKLLKIGDLSSIKPRILLIEKKIYFIFLLLILIICYLLYKYWTS